MGRLRQRVAMPLVMAMSRNFGQSALRKHVADAGFADMKVSHHDHHLSHGAAAWSNTQ
jgi:hypothetical protein